MQKDTEAVLNKRLAELSDALKHMESKNRTMSHDLDAATGTLAKKEHQLSVSSVSGLWQCVQQQRSRKNKMFNLPVCIMV